MDIGAGADQPILIRGPQSSWRRVRQRLADHHRVVVYGWSSDWAPDDLAEDERRRLLGRQFARYTKISHPEVRRNFLASRLLLKYAAAEAVGAGPEQVELAYRLGGRPYVRGCDQIDITLSHTVQLVVVGIATRGTIGVDVERADRRMYETGIAEDVCTPHERATLAALPEEHRNAALVRLWTLKEAYSKAIGQGMSFPFDEFGFAAGDPRPRLLRPDGQPAGDEWRFSTHVLDGTYAVGVALHESGFGESTDISTRTTLDDALLNTLLSSGGVGTVAA